MKVSGFTFIRNAVKFDYPVVEAITSVLPMVDEFIVMAGNSEDSTNELIASIPSDKIKIFHSVWDDSLRSGGRVLALETDKAMEHISADSDWAFYIQADEVVHETFHAQALESMRRWKDDKRVEGLLFNYTHFYGSYDFIGDSRRWYRKEVRIIRPHIGVQSWKDAQGFRIDGKPLKVKESGASIYHYGWVKPPEQQQAKQEYFHKLWHDDQWMKENIPEVAEFDYSSIDSVARFEGTHPSVMQARVDRQNWKVNIDPAKKKLSVRYKFLLFIERLTGWRAGEYKNYRILK
ncbi:MAG TPA: glycosyltransferase family 2 protein [Flavobacteriales bacterium]|nr:glycosyltransferase family 2 protein [Flavobacteriales bacterium]HPH82976.1 glycosyltransferase family 2 protein [Flavobacteriales bacterium]